MAYDKRELALRDQRAAITSALHEGRKEGELVGRIVMLQELLSLSTPTPEELSNYDLTQLAELVDQLRRQLRDRS